MAIVTLEGGREGWYWRQYRLQPNKRYVVALTAEWASCRSWTGFKADIADLIVVGETGAQLAFAKVFTDWAVILGWLKSLIGVVVEIISKAIGLGSLAEAVKSWFEEHREDINRWVESVEKALRDLDRAWYDYCPDKVVLFTMSSLDQLRKYGHYPDYARACATVAWPCNKASGRVWGVVALECDSKTCIARMPTGDKVDVGRSILFIAKSKVFEYHDGTRTTLGAAVTIEESGRWAFPWAYAGAGAALALAGLAAAAYYARRGGAG